MFEFSLMGRWACLAIAVTLLTGCGDNTADSAKAAGNAPAGKQSASKAFDVVTTSVATARVTYEIQAVGSLVEENRFQIPARVAGVADMVNFNEGDSVTSGQQICRLDYDRYTLLVNQAESAMAEKEAAAQRAEASVKDIERATSTTMKTAQVDLELAQNEFRRRADSGANAFTSPEELGQYDAKFRQAQNAYRDAVNGAGTQVALAVAQQREAQAALESARATLALARNNLERSIVRAPIDGVIQQRSVVEGQFVDQGNMVALMVQANPLRLRFTVPESRVARLSKEMKLDFSVPAYAGRNFTGQVYDIGAFADQTTREVICWARVDNKDGMLKPGFFTHVNLQVGSKDAAVVVPLATVLPTEFGMTAYVVEDGIARRRAVETGLNVTGDSIEILKGLETGDQLVLEGANALQDGVPVKVVPPGQRNINILDTKDTTAAQSRKMAENSPATAVGG